MLRPNERIAVAVWSSAEKAPALHVLVGPLLEYAEPDEIGYLPTPHELGGAGEMLALLARTEFQEPVEDRRTHTLIVTSEEEYMEIMLRGTPMGHSLQEEDLTTQEKVLAKPRQNLQAWRTKRGLELPCECVLVKAYR